MCANRDLRRRRRRDLYRVAEVSKGVGEGIARDTMSGWPSWLVVMVGLGGVCGARATSPRGPGACSPCARRAESESILTKTRTDKGVRACRAA